MSRSHRHFPYFYVVGPSSQAAWKRSYNRTIRRVARHRLVLWWDDADMHLPDRIERANPWSSPRDGTGFYCPLHPCGKRSWRLSTMPLTAFAHFKATRMK